MCIICISRKGVKLPDKKTLGICFQNNPDGLGYMVPVDGMVYIRKGFRSARKALSHIRQTLAMYHLTETDVPVVIHCRYATSGLTKPENEHPFPLSRHANELQRVEILTNTGMVHNGVLSMPKGNLSDTQLFVRDCLSGFSYEDFMRNRTLYTLVSHAIKSDRMALLDRSQGIIMWGDWIEDSSTGLEWSNSGYKHAIEYIGNYSRKWYDWKREKDNKQGYLWRDEYDLETMKEKEKDAFDYGYCEICGCEGYLTEWLGQSLCDKCMETA